jgi:hypothetical protein
MESELAQVHPNVRPKSTILLLCLPSPFGGLIQIPCEKFMLADLSYCYYH